MHGWMNDFISIFLICECNNKLWECFLSIDWVVNSIRSIGCDFLDVKIFSFSLRACKFGLESTKFLLWCKKLFLFIYGDRREEIKDFKAMTDVHEGKLSKRDKFFNGKTSQIHERSFLKLEMQA